MLFIGNLMHFEIPELKFDRLKLEEIASHHRDFGDWFMQDNGMKMMIDKVDLQKFPYGRHIDNCFSVKMNLKIFGLLPYSSSVLHVDTYRKVAINIPILGDYTTTPISFYNKEDDIIDQYYYHDNCCVILDTSKIHSVTNNTSEPRFVLSLTVPNTLTFDNLQYLYNSGGLIDSETFKLTSLNKLGLNNIIENPGAMSTDESKLVEQLKETSNVKIYKSKLLHMTGFLWAAEFSDGSFHIGNLAEVADEVSRR